MKKNLYYLLWFINVSCMCSVCHSQNERTQNDDKPNVLFIVVDDLRPEMGIFGVERAITPELDRFAKEALTFERAYCQQAVCNPSRASVMTGLRPDTTKVYDLKTHFRDTVETAVTIPEFFKNNGYITQGMGKIYHGHLYDPQSWSHGHTKFGGWPPYVLPDNRKLFVRLQTEHRKSGEPGWGKVGPAFEASDVPEASHADAQMTEFALTTMASLKSEPSPFFMAVGYSKPHLPFVAPKQYWDLYDRESLQLPENYLEQPPAGLPAAFRNAWFGELNMYLVPSGEMRNGTRILPEDFGKELIHGYLACVSFVDTQIGRLISGLKEMKLFEDTIIIIWGDHGFHLGDHGTWTKHTNFEVATRSPLLFRIPGMSTQGMQTDALIELVDIFPSLAEAASLQIPKFCEGNSFVPLTRDPERPWKTAAFSQYPFTQNKVEYMGYSMRTDRYRYTEHQKWDGSESVYLKELYDHRYDPAENKNLANEPDQQDLTKRLSKQLKAGWKYAAKDL